MFKIFFGIGSLAVGIFLFWRVVATVGIGEIAKGLFEFSPWGLIPLIVLTGIIQILGALKWQYVLRAMGVSVSLSALVKIFLAGNALSYVAPIAIGGEAVRGYVLRERYGVSWQKGLASIAIDKTCEAALWILVIFVGVVLFLLEFHVPWAPKAVIIGLSLLLLTALCIALLYLFIVKKISIVRPLILRPFHLEGSRGGQLLGEIEEEFFRFFSRGNAHYVMRVFKVMILKYAFSLLRNVFLIYYLHGTLSVVGSIITLGFSHLSYSIPIPAALGVQEGALSIVFAGIGLGAGLGTAFALLLRGADTIVTSIGLLFLLRWGLGKFAFHILRRFHLHFADEKNT